MKILITGAKGQLGLELQKQLQEANSHAPNLYEVFPTNHQTLDITNFENVQVMLEKVKPDVVINCAAHTGVDQCEEEKERADAINHLGPKYLATVCESIGAKLVQVSTDYVFSGAFDTGTCVETKKKEAIEQGVTEQGVTEEDIREEVTAGKTKIEVMEEIEDGTKKRLLAKRQAMAEESTPWVEDSSIDPQSVYGLTKAKGEEAVRTLCTKHFIIRTAWLYGEGANFVRTMLQLAKTHPRLTVVADQYGNPTSTKDLATAIINLIQTEHYGTYHGTCEGTCSWYDFAKEIFKLSKLSIDVVPVTSEAFPRPAKRPHYSSLENAHLKAIGMNTFRPWQEALADYLESELNTRVLK